MTQTVLINAILAAGVAVMVIAPLVWAILTQRRDHHRRSAITRAVAHPRAVRPGPRPRRPVAGRA